MKDDMNMLYEEYKLASTRVEDYQAMHFKFFNGLILGTAAIFTFISSGSFSEWQTLIKFLPYIFITFVSLVHYHYHRTLAVQGHRGAMELILNHSVNPDRQTLSFGKLSLNFIITPKGNWGMLVLTLTAILDVLAIVFCCNYNWTNRFDIEYFFANLSPHFFIQISILLLLGVLFYYSSTYTRNQACNQTLKWYFSPSEDPISRITQAMDIPTQTDDATRVEAQ